MEGLLSTGLHRIIKKKYISPIQNILYSLVFAAAFGRMSPVGQVDNLHHLGKECLLVLSTFLIPLPTGYAALCFHLLAQIVSAYLYI